MSKEKVIVLYAVNDQSAGQILNRYSKLRKLNPTIVTEDEKIVPAELNGQVDLLFYEKGTDPNFIISANRNIVDSRMINPNKNFIVVTGKVKTFLKSHDS